MHSNRFIVKEELSVSDTVVKITNEIYTQLLNKLSIGKSFIIFCQEDTPFRVGMN